MIPEGTYAEQIIDLIQDESNPDRDTILETLGSSLCISKEIDAVKALIDKLKEENRRHWNWLRSRRAMKRRSAKRWQIMKRR